jgi:prevent-host-death family protein
MKKIALSDIKDDLSRYLRIAEKEEIIITRHGKPAGLLVGFESEDDWFEYRLENDPWFLKRIEGQPQGRQGNASGRPRPVGRLTAGSLCQLAPIPNVSTTATRAAFFGTSQDKQGVLLQLNEGVAIL